MKPWDGIDRTVHLTPQALEKARLAGTLVSGKAIVLDHRIRVTEAAFNEMAESGTLEERAVYVWASRTDPDDPWTESDTEFFVGARL